MKVKIKIEDYSLISTITARTGFAKVEIFGREVEFIFSDEDAIIAGNELGLIEEPDDSDHTCIGYAKPYFSATVYENVGFEKGIQYVDNQNVLADYNATEYGEQIALHLALQSKEVREAIQSEATSIACCDCPPHIVGAIGIEAWMEENNYFFWANGTNLVDWEAVSQHKIAGLRTENKLVEKLL
jgi:hypothetical protein